MSADARNPSRFEDFSDESDSDSTLILTVEDTELLRDELENLWKNSTPKDNNLIQIINMRYNEVAGSNFPDNCENYTKETAAKLHEIYHWVANLVADRTIH
jgi:hypothetical protein